MAEKLKFIDLFAGIGGFHLALARQGQNAFLSVKSIATPLKPILPITLLTTH